MSDKINILATDDHTLFRKGTVMLLQTFSEIGNIFEAENGLQALEIIEEKEIDVILLDLEMPVMDGWQTAKKLLNANADIYIIMISMHDSLEIVSDLIEIGVHSYLLKDASPDELRRAIHTVNNDEFYYNQLVSRALHNKMKNGKNSKELKNTDIPLTKRELEVLQLICEELTMKEIGDQLYVSEQTIHTHRKNLMKKTQVRNTVGLVKFAIQNQIISL